MRCTASRNPMNWRATKSRRRAPTASFWTRGKMPTPIYQWCNMPNPKVVNGIEELKKLAGQEVGVSGWLPVTQEMIDQFADLTGDHQWIHVDVERARRDTPFHSTIAHGFL